MYNLNTFIENCKAFLKSQIVKVPNSATKSQQKFEFEQELKKRKEELEKELQGQANNWGNLAYENGHSEILKLRSNMKNEIRTLLREWKVEQMEKSGLDD